METRIEFQPLEIWTCPKLPKQWPEQAAAAERNSLEAKLPSFSFLNTCVFL